MGLLWLSPAVAAAATVAAGAAGPTAASNGWVFAAGLGAGGVAAVVGLVLAVAVIVDRAPRTIAGLPACGRMPALGVAVCLAGCAAPAGVAGYPGLAGILLLVSLGVWLVGGQTALTAMMVRPGGQTQVADNVAAALAATAAAPAPGRPPVADTVTEALRLAGNTRDHPGDNNTGTGGSGESGSHHQRRGRGDTRNGRA